MKKICILFLVLAMLLVTLCSCNKVNEETSSDVTGAASTTVSLENDTETTSSEESEVSDVISSETSSDTVVTTPSKVTPPANTNSTESTPSKVTPPANTNSAQSTPSKVTPPANTKSTESTPSKVTPPANTKSTESTPSKVTPPANTNSAETTSSEVTPSETTSSEAKPVYKSIDEVPKIALEGDPVPFTASGGKDRYEDNIKFSRIVRTREELLAFYEEYDLENYKYAIGDGYGSETYKYTFSSFINAKNKYDDEYFKENALILLYSDASSSSYNYRFDCIVKKDEKLYVGLLRWVRSSNSDYASTNCECSAFSYIVEVKKSDIQDIEDIEIVKKFEIITSK